MMRRLFLSLAVLVLLVLPRDARAEESSLFETGKIVFASSYGVTAAAGMPSAVGGAGRIVFSWVIIGRAFGGHCQDSSFDEYLCYGQHGGAALVIPVVGPILFTSLHAKDTLLNPNGSYYSLPVHLLAYTATAVQLTGIAMMVFGKSAQNDARDRPAARSVSVQPTVAAGSVGLGVSGVF